jgi:hypothetical protein
MSYHFLASETYEYLSFNNYLLNKVFPNVSFSEKLKIAGRTVTYHF